MKSMYNLEHQLTSLSKKITKLGKCFTDTNNKYDELSETYKINEYFSLESNNIDLKKSKHAIYDFCNTQSKICKNYEEKLSNIRAIITNEFIDVIFLGRCSVGKSKIINAILMENILPCAPSATTHCFVEISESNNDINYLRCNKNEKKSFEFDELICEVNNNVSKMSDSCCGFNETVEIFVSQSRWKTKVTNGKHIKNIRLIDTPGYDNCKLSYNSNDNSSIEKSIIDRCKIANIIVFVVTHNLSDKEKQILERLSKISSKLSIIVLVNKWDLSKIDSDQTGDESKLKIRNSFLEKPNKINLNDKIFFVSAVEQINKRSDQYYNIKQLDPLSNQNDKTESNEIDAKLQNEFHNFIQHLNERIIGQNNSKFDEQICMIYKFYNERKNKYEEYIRNLRDNIKSLTDPLNEIKGELKILKEKFDKKSSKIKRGENVTCDSSKMVDWIYKLDGILDSKKEELQIDLQNVYDCFIKENYSHFNSCRQQRKQSITRDQEKMVNNLKGIFKMIKTSFPKIKMKPDNELPRGFNQNDHFFTKLNDSFNTKLSGLTDQIDNIMRFFESFKEL